MGTGNRGQSKARGHEDCKRIAEGTGPYWGHGDCGGDRGNGGGHGDCKPGLLRGQGQCRGTQGQQEVGGEEARRTRRAAG